LTTGYPKTKTDPTPQYVLVDGSRNMRKLKLKGLTTAQRDALDLGSTDRAIIWNTTTTQIEVWDGSSWIVYVATSGNQTIAGVKTFSSIPVGPASDPTTNNQLARKAYVDASGGGFSSRCRAYRGTSDQTIGSGAWTKILFNTEDYDSDSEFASSRFTATNAGYYLISISALILNLADGDLMILSVYKNGVASAQTRLYMAAAGHGELNVSDIASLSATDYIEGYVYHNYGANRDLYSESKHSYIAIQRLS